ncbi:MAG: NAD(P)-binding protein [Pseudomonadota bacterium]
MSTQRDPRFDILFEPVTIGPKQAKNRFYQVPHCNGAGYRDPTAAAEMRRVKSEGGWGVVFTEQVEIHHSSEIAPFIELHLWDDRDVPMLARMADAMKSHGALAGIELAYSGINGPNLYTKEVPLAASAGPILTYTPDPVQARALDTEDMKDLRRWYRNAARRAKEAGFDIICLYGAHGFGIIQHFLSRLTNRRTDSYGGSLANRARLFKELVEDAREETKGDLAIAVRLSLNEAGDEGFSNAELRDLIAMHADVPDLWDLAHGTWEECSGTSRFKDEGAQEDLVRGIRDLTSKPVVGVGRFTSPDAMVRQVRSGVLDFIGAARPSIADPYLPKKVEEGRLADIRECIGCNICVTGDMTMSISRCTQNSSFMEEWRKGWHPERIQPKGESDSVLIVGAGPAGLEASVQLGRRGYRVAMAEAGTELGGRVRRECQLPGLSAWGRVTDWRQEQLIKLPNVDVYFDSGLDSELVLEFGFQNICVATGCHWRRDVVARHHLRPIPTNDAMTVLTPDDLMDGIRPKGHVVLYDDDHFYMGGVLAEFLIEAGCPVTLITPAPLVSQWTVNTLEQGFIQSRLMNRGVRVRTGTALDEIEDGGIALSCVHTGRREIMEADSVVLVCARTSDDALYRDLVVRRSEWADAGILSVEVIGDAAAPAPIAWATYAGRRYAETLDQPDLGDALPFRREIAELLPR